MGNLLSKKSEVDKRLNVIQDARVSTNDSGTTLMVDVKSIESEREEYPKHANGETGSSTRSTCDEKSLVSKAESYVEIVNGEMDSSGTEVIEKRTVGNADSLNDQNLVASPSTDFANHHVVQLMRSRKVLLILDVNGLLADIIHPPPKDCKSDINILKRAIFKRPFLNDFIGFCFDRFDVAIWSSRTRKILNPVVDYLLGDWKKKLLFLWDLSHCTSSCARSLENRHKFIVFKKLRKIWEENGPVASENGYYDESNTLLLDDSPYKALLNHKNTGIFPLSYRYKDLNDNSLGPDGDLRVYLEGVAATENVKLYVERHPFGQGALDETSPHWELYSKALKDVF